MDDTEILARIRGMVEAEHELRQQAQDSGEGTAPVRDQLRRLEESLDQCWDLLRQRRARSEFDQDPDAASARPVDQVEGYLS
jgi:hypothetical protein